MDTKESDKSDKFMNVVRVLSDFFKSEGTPSEITRYWHHTWHLRCGLLVRLCEPKIKPKREILFGIFLEDYVAFLANVPEISYIGSVLGVVSKNGQGRCLRFLCERKSLYLSYRRAKRVQKILFAKATDTAKATCV